MERVHEYAKLFDDHWADDSFDIDVSSMSRRNSQYRRSPQTPGSRQDTVAEKRAADAAETGSTQSRDSTPSSSSSQDCSSNRLCEERPIHGTEANYTTLMRRAMCPSSRTMSRFTYLFETERYPNLPTQQIPVDISTKGYRQ